MTKKLKSACMLLIMVGSFLFPVTVFAEDAGEQAQMAATHSTATEWNKMKDYLTQFSMPELSGYTKTVYFPENFLYNCSAWVEYEYAYTGPAKRIITNVTSSDSSTVSTDYASDYLKLTRGNGLSREVTITVEYYLDWSFSVEEKVLGVWWRVNDQIGKSSIKTDSFTVSVSQSLFSVTPKTDNKIELNLFDETTYNPRDFVNLTGVGFDVIGSYLSVPDDSKLGKTKANLSFTNGYTTKYVTAPITVVDTTPPNGELKNPITVELGTSPDSLDFFSQKPKDNDLQEVAIQPNFDPQFLGIGSYLYSVRLTDHSGNYTDKQTTLIIEDTIPPQIVTKNFQVEYGGKIEAKDFIESFTDNDKNGTVTFTFSNGQPDTYVSGEKEVSIIASDRSGNEVEARAKLTVNPDSLPPSASGKQQFIPIGSQNWEKDPIQLLTDISDNSDLTTLKGEYIKTPDTSKLGQTIASVRLSDQAGNYSEIDVPFFVYDPGNTNYDEPYVLQAKNFTIYSNQVTVNDEQELQRLIRKNSQAKGWKLENGISNDITDQIVVASHTVDNKVGTYTATLTLGKVERTININVLDANDLIDISLPEKVLFGSTDINKGGIISPTYELENHTQTKVDLSLEKVVVNPNSSIRLLNETEGKPSGVEEAVDLFLWSDLNNSPIVIQEASQSVKIGTVLGRQTSTFFIDGKYYGDYAQKRNLAFTFVFKLEARPY